MLLQLLPEPQILMATTLPPLALLLGAIPVVFGGRASGEDGKTGVDAVGR